MLTVASATRRGRRAASQAASWIVTGRRVDQASRRARRGVWAVSASADTVLVRAARSAGTRVASAATAMAAARTTATVGPVTSGGPALPRRPEPGLVNWGAAARPIARPMAAATTASTRYSAMRTPATISGVD